MFEPAHEPSVPGLGPHWYVPCPLQPVRPVVASFMHCHEPELPVQSRVPDDDVVHVNETPAPLHDVVPPLEVVHVNASVLP